MSSELTASLMALATVNTAPAPKKTDKRDFLVDLEQKYQREWQNDKVFQVDPPTRAETTGLSKFEIQEKYPKWFGTFPYPYMNGSLHLGHAFTISKVEFAAGFQRMLGKRVLFPLGFHCTGMPIKSAADKIIKEMEMFGTQFENYNEEEDLAKAAAKEDAPVHVKAAEEIKLDKAKKGKMNAKSTGLKYQFQIMLSSGVPIEDIHKFADPLHWITYFPPLARADLDSFGAKVDWRRSFVTTDVNPYYDAFVRWQINLLRNQETPKVQFGKRHTIYSPKDGQACMDHDRASGEAKGPQEYTAMKLKVGEWGPLVSDEVKSLTAGKTVYMVSATLRPETMYGQTNLFLSPTIKYSLIAASPTEIYLMSYRAARNMSYQNLLNAHNKPEDEAVGEVVELGKVLGSTLMGTIIDCPFSILPRFYVVPMDTVLASKGTGVVSCVPSDSPDDYMTTLDLRKKAEWYKIKPEWVALEPVPVLSTPSFGEMSAPFLCQKYKIQSSKDSKALAEAKDESYLEGFHKGVMSIGEFKGMPVAEAKGKVKEKFIASGDAFLYSEPEELIMSRSGDECVVALCDQWFIDYSEPDWKVQAHRSLQNMNTYFPETRNALNYALSWLNQWPCARSFGLGSRLPWDPQFVIESLSDSTIYMSYYTIAHMLQGDIEGQTPGTLGISAEDLTDDVFNYIFTEAPMPEKSKIPSESLLELKHAFEYFYPLDLRSTGKDLINNHMSFCIYVHSAIFEEYNWPKSMRANGHLLMNGAKMSKSKGNSLTLRDSVEKFGVDATRLTLADAGDGFEDANFEESSADANIRRMFTLVEWCQTTLNEKHLLRQGPKDSIFDRTFEAQMRDLVHLARKSYEISSYKEAMKYGWYEFLKVRDLYRDATVTEGMHQDLLLTWIRRQALLIAPLAPHAAEHIWKVVLGEHSSIQLAQWPEVGEADREVLAQSQYLRDVIKNIREAEIQLVKRSKHSGFKSSKSKGLRIYVAETFPEWQSPYIDAIRQIIIGDGKFADAQNSELKKYLEGKDLLRDKRGMPFVQNIKKRIEQFGPETLERAQTFSETDLLENIKDTLMRQLSMDTIEIITQKHALSALSEKSAGEQGWVAETISKAEPGVPTFAIWNL